MVNQKTIKTVSVLVGALFVLNGCIKQGISEPDYFLSAADKSELTEKPNQDGYTFNRSEFYKKHVNYIESSDDAARVNMHYVESGNVAKPAVLFVHGTPGGWKDFNSYLIFKTLKNNAHLVTVDRPGWGKSSCLDLAEKECFFADLETQSKYFNTLIEKLNEQNNGQGIILVGYSLGGPLIAQLAVDYPKAIKGLVFVAAPFSPKMAAPRWYNRFSQIFSWFMPEELDKSNQEMLVLTEHLNKMENHWSTFNQPTWVIQGAIDDLVYPENMDYAKQVLSNKNTQFIAVPDSGHFVVWEKKSIIVNAITQALNKLPSQ